MPDNITEIQGLPVNTEGEVVARLGTGGRGVAGTLPKGYNPVNAAGEMMINLAPATTGDLFVTARTNPVTGGVGILAGGVQVGGTASPYAFTFRALTDADNGQTLVCASAQVATVNTGLPVGFGVAFKGVITFTGSATVTDVRTTGATNPWAALTQTGVDTYDVVGSKA